MRIDREIREMVSDLKLNDVENPDARRKYVKRWLKAERRYSDHLYWQRHTKPSDDIDSSAPNVVAGVIGFFGVGVLQYVAAKKLGFTLNDYAAFILPTIVSGLIYGGVKNWREAHSSGKAGLSERYKMGEIARTIRESRDPNNLNYVPREGQLTRTDDPSPSLGRILNGEYSE